MGRYAVWESTTDRGPNFRLIFNWEFTLGGRHAGAGMDAGVVNALQPDRELCVEFFEGGGALPRQAQPRFKILLYGQAHSFDFSLALGCELHPFQTMHRRSSRSRIHSIRGAAADSR